MATPHQGKRILFDLSTSYAWRGQHAVGIVRTEREIAARILGDPNLDVVPVIFHGGQLRAISTDQAFDIISSPKPAPKSITTAPAEPPIEAAVEAAVEASLPPRPGFAKGVHRFAKWVARGVLKGVPQRSREDFRQSLIFGREALKKMVVTDRAPPPAVLLPQEPLPPPPSPPPPQPVHIPLDFSLIVHPSKNDVLFLCGLGWDVIDCKRLSEIKVSSGMKIASVMYDLIPVKFPNLAGGNPMDYFYNYFLHMVDLSEHIFCISKCTERDLIEFMEERDRPLGRTSVFYLGANISTAPDGSEIADEPTRERLRKGRYALTVGTFEIRKNYRLLLDIWPDLVKDPEFDLDLVIVGMPGWGNDEIMENLRQSPLLGRRIFWFNKLGDGGLSWLYENCNVFVFPSLYEGWGLPVVEALQHGKPVIVSDQGSSPEAGLEVATIVAIDDRQGWINAIKEASTGRLVASRPKAIPSWDEAANEARSRLLNVVGA
ncbi:glycosyltransferase family 4 protein [Mesorhizobium sp. B292B1B]|uniref:glycosyltransferase family 4 protein n=1 Tax=unclassified Mesorhizobium TaxID=325217 RepID=UPI00112EA670|nr:MULTISPECIES: glycosyltransferase family 1 protein [unclassified Mesorhizobium]MCA0012910.1 glycosyltransferase family 4 protein [Mesorhizobium sp. B294B1A1]MCA0037589.1 glycosyltransferase family 4 protein [Mesorhizobium sp. B292B1B]TPM50696.1 glycosyltransferase family 4 protein [Mesorhizobium sp. B2-3-2]